MAFLKVVPLEKALEVVQSFKISPGIEEVPIEKGLGRIAAEDIYSPIDVPPFDRATVDGYAVRAEDTFMASEASPVRLKVIGSVHAGEEPKFKLGKGEAAYISTGAMLPGNADAVIQFEDVERVNGEILIYKPAYPGLGVMKKGIDIEKGRLLVKKGERLGFKQTALLSAVGINKVKVFRKPKVAVISTGNEIVPPGNELKPGQIYDINGRALCDAINELGGEGIFMGVARDDKESLKALIEKAVNVGDVVVISGGASGERRI